MPKECFPTSQSRLAKAVPPADLLDQVEGIEQGLQQRKRLGAAGVIALGLSVLQIVLALGITGVPDFSSLKDSWPYLLGGILLVAALLLLGRARFWIRESKRPFRYTYSVGEFEPLTKLRDDAFLVWLREDLTEKLASRIQRLSRLDEAYTDASDGVHHDTHIHVTGSIGARRGQDGVWLMEILPWIRIGPPDTPATLAHPIKFRAEGYSGMQPPPLSPDNYEKLFERMYFNIATELYERIGEDVERKISLLPGRYLRAVAYFHEAVDYANSNTLDAYEAAEELYERVLKLYDPHRDTPAQSKWRQFRWIMAVELGLALHAIRLKLSVVIRRAGRVELLVARAYIGFANTLLYRRVLAGYSGRRLNPVFETRDATLQAVTRLRRLSPDIPGRREALFDAYVTRALALAHLASPGEAQLMHRRATELDPRRAETDPAYLLVAGDLEPRVLQSIELYRRAVEEKPDFEAAQFSLARETETLWRTRPELEKTVAAMVFDEYEAVTRLNPGNIAAWANLGYMRWLLEDREEAALAFYRARDYKEVKRETFVSELDYGLARIAAEGGDFAEAYKRYINAVAAQLAQGVAYGGGYTGYYFESLTDALVERFDEYQERVAEHWRKPRAEQLEDTTERVRDSVYAFVLNDCAEAHFNFYLRSGDPDHLNKAFELLRFASDELNTRYVMVYVNLYRLTPHQPELTTDDAERFVRKISELAPSWTDGTFTLVQHEIARMRDAKVAADAAKGRAALALDEADDLRRQAEECRERSSRQREVARRERLASALLSQPPRQETAPGRPREGHWEPQGDVAAPVEGSPVPLGGNEAARRADDRATALVAAAAGLDRQAPEREAVAKEHKAEAERHDAEARDRARNAKETLEPLLAHRALWREQRQSGGRTFSWDSFTRPEVLQDHRWERELSDLDVRALCAWCETCLALQGAEQQDRLSESERFTDEQVRKLADYIRARFLEDDLDILRALVEHEPADTDVGRDLRRRFAGRIEFWLDREVTYWGFTWIEEEYFSSDQMIARFRSMAARPDLPSYLAVMLLVGLGDMLFDLGEWSDSKEAYEAARERDAERESPVNSRAFYSQAIGRVAWRIGSPQEAVSEYRGWIESAEQGTHEAIVRDLVESGALHSADGFFWLRSWLEEEGASARKANDQLRIACYESAGRVLAKAYLAAVRRPESPYGVERAPYVDPLALEVDREAMDAREPELFSRLIEEGLREIETGLGESSGFNPPAVTVTPASGLDPHLYSILVHGVPIDRGPPPSVDAGDLYGDLVSHVSDVVLPQLDSFADAPAVEQLCRSWAGGRSDRIALCGDAMRDAGSLLRLVEVIRALLRERVPLHDLGSALEVFVAERDGTPDIHELVEKIRRPLAGSIASAVGDRRRVELPSKVLATVGAGIRADNGDRFLAMPIPKAYEAHRAIEHSLGVTPARDCVAVVPDPSLRPFTWELVAECCPELLVLSPDEFAGRARQRPYRNPP